MEGAIEASYQGGYATALRRLTRLLDDVDEVDHTIDDLGTRLELAVSAGADGKRIKNLQMELEERLALLGKGTPQMTRKRRNVRHAK